MTSYAYHLAYRSELVFESPEPPIEVTPLIQEQFDLPDMAVLSPLFRQLELVDWSDNAPDDAPDEVPAGQVTPAPQPVAGPSSATQAPESTPAVPAPALPPWRLCGR